MLQTVRERGRKIVWKIAGGALLVAPFMVGAQTPPAGGTPGWTQGKINAGSTGLPTGSVYNIIEATLSWLLGILGFIAIIGFVISGLLYLTAAGDENQMERGKNAMLYSIIGVVVALVAFVIVKAVDSWLTGNSFAF